MVQMIEEYWLLITIAFLIGVAIAWYVFHATRRTRVTGTRSDPLDEGAQKTTRNEALINSPRAAGEEGAGVSIAATDAEDAEASRTAASPGATSAAANADSTAASPLGTDAETGDGIPMREAMKQVPPEPDPDHAQKQNAATGSGGEADDLSRIKGVGPKLKAQLNELGVTSFAQIAAWDDADVARIDGQLGRFQGRIERDDWRQQARLLEAGDTDAFEAKFGRTG